MNVELSFNDINQKEIYRYLGYRGNTPDTAALQMIREVLGELLSVIHPKNLYKIYRCSIDSTNAQCVTLYDTENQLTASIQFVSRNLADNLKGCHYVILLAATLGIEADKLLHKYEMTNMTKASILQACSAACIEAFCNGIQEELRCKALEKNMYLRPRFSPGYGDLPLSAQKDFFSALDCTKRLGLTLTDSLLMYPTKSVTAFIGVTPHKESCHIGKCSQCNIKGCEFRNEDT